MAERRASVGSTMVVCPNCGRPFNLEAKVVDQLRDGWEKATRKSLRGEILEEIQPTLDKRVKQLAAGLVKSELGAKDEEVQLLTTQIKRLRGQVRTLSRNVPQEGAQELGAIREVTIAERLGERFTDDEIRQVPKGRRGGDIVQVVRNSRGRDVGSILWESKRAKNWDSAWVRKLKDDQKRGRNTLAVLATDAQPSGAGPISESGGVWVTSPDLAVPLAVVLRESLIQVAGVKRVTSERDDLKGRTYDYLTSQEFAARVKGVVETAIRMRQAIDAEKAKTQAQWSERESQVDDIVTDMAQLWGGLRALGASTPRISVLEQAESEKPALPAPRT